jgi:hypothetical protein
MFEASGHISHATAVFAELAIAATVLTLIKRDEWAKAVKIDSVSKDSEDALLRTVESDAIADDIKHAVNGVLKKRKNNERMRYAMPIAAFTFSVLVLFFMSFHVEYVSDDVLLFWVSLVSFALSILVGQIEYSAAKKEAKKEKTSTEDRLLTLESQIMASKNGT